MPTTPLSLVKAHLNVEGDADDELLTHYINTSEAWCSAYTGQPFGGTPLETQAVLMLVAHQFEAREAVVFSSAYALPYGVADMLSPIKTRITGYVPEPEPEPEAQP